MKNNDTGLIANSETLRMLNLGHPDLFEDVNVPQLAPNILKIDRQIRETLQSVVQNSEDPYEAINRFDTVSALNYFGLDMDTANSIADGAYLKSISGVDLSDKSYGEALITKAKHAWWADLSGLSTSLYAITGSKKFLDSSAEYKQKMFANPVLQSYGEFGDFALESVQPTLSALKFIAVDAVLSWIPGGISHAIWGKAAGELAASGGHKLATATNFLLTGYSQAGQVLDEVMNLTDDDGNKLPWDSTMGKILFHGLAGLMGIVELGSMEMMPWYRTMKQRFTQREIAEFVKLGFKAGAKQFTFNVVKGTASEAGEELVQTSLGIGFTEILKVMANKDGAQFEHISLGEVARQGAQAFWEAGKSMALTSVLFEGIGLGINLGARSYEAGKYFNKTKGSTSVDLGFIAMRTNGAKASETQSEGKKAPVKVINLGSHLSPVDEAEMQKVLDAAKAGAKAVEVEVQEMGEMEAGDRESLLHRAAIASGGKISGDSIVFDSPEALRRGAYVLQHSVESRQQDGDVTRIVLRDENGDLVELNLRVKEEADEIIEPDISFYEDPEAPHSLARMSQEKALEWEERKRIEEALGDIVGHTGGRVSKADLEANIDAVKLVGETLGLTTDEMLEKALMFRLVDEAPQGARGYIDNVSTADGPQYVIHLSKNADASTILHELGHFLRGMGTKEQLQSFTEHYGKGGSVVWLEDVVQNEDGTYSVDGKTYETFEEARELVERNEEAFANDFVTYLRTGEAPTEELGNIFRRMKAVLKKFIGEFGYRLDPKVKASFDELLSKPGSGAGGGAAGAAGSTLWQRSNEFANMMHRLITDDFRDHRERTEFLSSLHRVVPYQDWNFSLDIPHAMKVRSTGIEAYGSFRKHVQDGSIDKKSTGHPEITDDIMMRLPEAMEHPVAVIARLDDKGNPTGEMWYITDLMAQKYRAPQSASDVGGYVPRPVVVGLRTSEVGSGQSRTIAYTAFGLGFDSDLANVEYLAKQGMLLALDAERGSHVLTGTNTDASTLQEASPRRIVKLPVNVNKQRQFQSAPVEGSAIYASLVDQAHELLKEGGRLIEFFHGSNMVIDDYDTAKRGSLTGAQSAELAFYFTKSEEVAKEYADLASEAQPLRQRQAEIEAEAEALFDAMLEMDRDDFESEKEYDRAMDELDGRRSALLEEGRQLDEYIASGDRFYYREEWGRDSQSVVNRVVLTAPNLLVVEGDVDSIYSVVKQAKADGYDGVYFKDIHDSPSESVMTDNVAIFNPDHIYSTSLEGDGERLYQKGPGEAFYNYQDANMERTHKELFYIDGMNSLFAERIENAGDIGRELSKFDKYGWMGHTYVGEKMDKLATILEGGPIAREFLQRPATAELRAQEQAIVDRYKEQYDAYPGELGTLGEVSKRLSFAILDRDLYSALDAWAEFITLWNPLRAANGQSAFPVGEYSAELQWAVKDKAAEMVLVGDTTSALSDELVDNTLYQLAPEGYQPEKTGVGYKVFALKDGKLYPPKVANPQAGDTPMGVWLLADAAPIVRYSKTGRPQVKSGGPGTNGGGGTLAFRPGWHLGEIPYATQFNRTNPITGAKELFPSNFVWAEVEYAMDRDYNDEARAKGATRNGGFSHAFASLGEIPTDGYYNYRTNPDPTTDSWIITGAMKVNRLLAREEVDDLVRKAGREPQKVVGDTLYQKAEEHEAVRQRYEGTDQWLKAPNGKPTNLSEEQWVAVRTEAFKAWFGDWENDPKNSSQVLDANGEPRVMYHGSRVELTEFDPSRGTNVDAIYHASDLSVASHFSGDGDVHRFITDDVLAKLDSITNKEDLIKFAKDTLGVGLEFLSGYTTEEEAKAYRVDSGPSYGYSLEFSGGFSTSLGRISGVTSESAQIDYIKDRLGTWFDPRRKRRGFNYANFINLRNPVVIDAKGKSYWEIRFDGMKMNTESIASWAKEHGHDGVIVKNVMETSYESIKTDDVISFDPAQIKSATNNVGTYDPYNPSILYQVEAYHGSPHQFDRFSLDYVGTGEGAQVYGWGLYFTDNKRIAEYYARELTEPKIVPTYTHDGVIYADSDDALIEQGIWKSPEAQAMRYLLYAIDVDSRDILHTRRGKEMVRETAIKFAREYSTSTSADALKFLENMDIDNLEFGQNKRKLYKATLLKGRDQDSHAWLEWNKRLLAHNKNIVNILEEIIEERFDNLDDIYSITPGVGHYWSKVYSKAKWEGMSELEKESASWQNLYTRREAAMLVLTGERLYDEILRTIEPHPGREKEASLYLLSKGIDGIMYPAASRGRGDGSKGYNYVVFDENSITMESVTLFQEAPPVESKAFKDWFGNSKVVDENGQPLVLYHGTDAEFDSFVPKDGKKRVSNKQLDFGSHFTVSREYAQTYSRKGNVIPVYLSMNNPLDLVDANFAYKGDPLFDALFGLYNDLGQKPLPDMYRDRDGNKHDDVQAVFMNAHILNALPPARALAAIKDAGFDGVKYQPYQRQGLDRYTKDPVSYIAISPTQVKSFHNQGTWDSNNPNIFFQNATSVETDAFKDWFGDWENDPANSSKALDWNGRPLVLYRGSTQKGVNVLPRSFEAGIGIFLTDSPSVAEIFRYEREYGDVITERYDENTDEYVDVEGGDLYELYANIRSPKVFEGEEAQRLTDDARLQAEAIRVAKEEGHDGIILRNVREGVASWTERGTTYVVLDPTQIKSIHNQGTWNPGNPNILFQDAPPVETDSFKTWFRESKVVDDEGKPLIVYHNTTERFDAFDLSKARSIVEIPGFFFTNDRHEYSDMGPRQIQAYVSIQNPYEGNYNTYKGIKGGSTDNAYSQIRQALIDDGYDGIILKDDGVLEVIAFYPEQIKSATDNSGAYSTLSRNILFQAAQPVWDGTVLSIADLQRMGVERIFPLFADRTMAGIEFTGYRAITIDPTLMLGGPGFPAMEQHKGLGWAVQGDKQVRKISARINETGGYAVVVMMQDNTHRSNIMVAKNYIKLVEQAIRDGGRINLDAIAEINKEIQSSALLRGAPGIETEGFDHWLDNASFESRWTLMDTLSKASIQKLGLPPIDGYLKSTMEKRFNVPSLDPGDGLMIIKLDADNIQENVHPSYRYAIGGELIGFLRKPLGRNLLFEQIMANYKGQQNVDYNDIRRSVELSMPSIEITGKMVELDMGGGYEHISGPRHARMVLDGMLDEWSTTDTPKKDGGVSIADYRKALLTNDGWVSYPHRDFSTLEKDVKAGRAKVYKLGESDVYFTLIRETPWHSKITGAGEEVVLTGVINNELYGGALPMIMAKAIEEGATMLDAFDVQTEEHGQGMASTVYSRYGFEQVGEPIQVSAEEFLQGRDKSVLADAQVYWDSLGWTRQSDVPPVVVMRLNEEIIGGRAGYLQRLGTQDVQDILPGTTGGGLAGAEHDLQYGRDDSGQIRRSEPGAGFRAEGSEGRSGRPSGRAHVSPTAQEILDLSDIDILNLNLDPEKVQRARDIYAPQRLFQQAPLEGSVAFEQALGRTKIVDKDGNPRKVYHGSLRSWQGGNADFDKTEISSQSDSGDVGAGFYFTENMLWANAYAGDNINNIGSYYLDIRNPLVLGDEYRKELDEAFKRELRRESTILPTVQRVADMVQRAGYDPGSLEKLWGYRSVYDIVRRIGSANFTEILKANGYDGVIYLDEVVAFEPEQVFYAGRPESLPESRPPVVEIDGVQYTIHDTEYTYSEEEIRDIATGVDRDLAEISQRPDLRDILYQPASERRDTALESGPGNLHPDYGTVVWNPHRGYSHLRGWDGTEVDPRIDEDWAKFRKIDFAGYKIESATELAQLFSIYRNPMLEYFHIIYTKSLPGGNYTILGHRAMSSGVPNATVALSPIFPHDLNQELEALGADGYFLMHNHPSGEVKPSPQDINVTRAYSGKLIGRNRGHIILDHNKYTLIPPSGKEPQVGIEAKGFHHVEPRSIIRGAISSVDDAAEYGLSVMGNRDAVIIYTDSQYRVLSVEPIALNEAGNDYVLDKLATGYYSKAFYVTTEFKDWKRVHNNNITREMYNGRVFADIIRIDRETGELIASVRREGLFSKAVHDWGVLKIANRSIRAENEFAFEPTRLYQLSDAAKQEVLDRRKEDVKQAVERFFWVPDEILSEYAGEDWADEEILFRSRMREFPELERQALEYASVDEYLEAMETEDAVEQQWYRRVFEYARIMDPKDKDAQFVRIFSTDHGLIRLASLLRSYTDYRDGREVQRWGSFRGVSTLVKGLNSESSSEDLQRARELVEKDPRPYRRALQTVEQAQDRVQEARGQSPTSQANRDAYYDALGETMQDELRPSLDDLTNREAAERLRTSHDRRERYDARDRLATHAGVWAVEQQANAELKDLGVQKDADINTLRRQLDKARKEATKVGRELKEQKKALRSAQSALDKETARRKDYADQAREHKSRATQLARDLKDRRERVATLRSQLSEKREEVRGYRTRVEKLQKRITAERQRKALERVHNSILNAARFNPDSVDASFEQAMNAIVELFNQDGRPGPYKQLPEQMRQYLGDEALHWVQQGRRITDWTLGELEALEEAVHLMRMDGRLMLEQKKMHRSAMLQDYALRYYAQLHGTVPDVDFALGGVMGQIIDELNATHPKYKETPFNAFFNTIVGSIIHSQRLARLIDGNKEGVMYDILVRQVYDNSSSELANTFRRMEAAEAMMKELGITDNYLDKVIYTYTTTAGQEIDLTRGEVIGLYVYSQNEESMQKLIMSWGNAIPVDQVSEAVSKLTDNDRTWGDYMIDALGGDDAWERMRDVYYNVYNRNLGRRERYFTFVAEGKVDEGNTDLLVGPRGDTVRYVDKGMTKPIVPNARYALKLNVTSTFKSQVRRQEHFISWAKWVRDTNYLLSRLGSVGQMIEMNHGPKILKQVQEFTNAVGSPQTILQDIERLGNKLVSSAAVANLSFNMITVLKQFASISAAVRGDIEVGMLFNAARRLANPAEAKKIVAFIHEKSPLVKNRTFDVEIAKYRATDFDSKLAKGVKKLNEAGMKLAEWTDAATANVLWLAAYDTAIKRGLSDKEAAFRATQLIAETQSSSNTADLSLVQRMKNPWVRAVLQYTNDAFQHINQVWFDLPFYVKNKNYKQAIGTIVSLSVAWAITLLVGGHFFKGDDDDDKRKRLMGELLQLFIEDTIPIIGRPISMGASGWRGSNDLVSLPSEIGQFLGALSRSDGKGLSKEFWDLVESASKASGLPVTQVRRTIKAVENENPLYFLNNNWSYLWEDR